MKRVIDTVFASIGLVLLSPCLLIVLIIIVLLEKKSPLFVQERLGRDKKVFQIYKLRTMLDGEITSLGKILRKTGIDELPQLVNILLGDMSFVGPRPLLELDVVRLGWTGDYYVRRWSVRPGVTGLAQLGARCHRKITWVYDRYYVENTSLCLEMKLLCLSVGVPFLGKSMVRKLVNR